jgi:two-component system OmpR family sensor kinase
LHAEFDISPLLAERREALWTLLSTNAVLMLAIMLLGWFMVRRMVRPMKILSDHLERAHYGGVKPIPVQQSPGADSEAGRLFRRFNEMAEAVAENTALAARLAEEKRLGSLGRLATGMAHEINNPLGGLFNAIDTLKKHGDKPMVRVNSLSLIERGLYGIRDVVQAALATYRDSNGGRPLTVQDFEDVRLLLGPELRRRSQALEWTVDADPLPVLQGNLVRQAVINLLLNASAASGQSGHLSFEARRRPNNGLTITVGDSGPGLPTEALGILTGECTDAMVGKGKGLGLWMVRRFIDEAGGKIEVGASALGGAEIRLRFPVSMTETEPDAA